MKNNHANTRVKHILQNLYNLGVILFTVMRVTFLSLWKIMFNHTIYGWYIWLIVSEVSINGLVFPWRI